MWEKGKKEGRKEEVGPQPVWKALPGDQVRLWASLTGTWRVELL